MSNNFAHLKPDHWAYGIFPHGTVPIHNVLVPNQVKLENNPETEAYMVDLYKCSPTQIDSIVKHIANGRASPERVKAEILEHGLPLRASQCTGVSTDSRAFL
jgi:hypothetical protein